MKEYSAPHLRIGVPAEAGALQRIRVNPASRRARHNRGAELLAAIVLSVLFVACGTVYFTAGLLQGKAIHQNISIDGVDVGGMTYGEARQLFSGREVPAMGISLIIDDRTFTVTAGDVGAQYNVGEVIDEAYNIGRNGSVVQRLTEILSLRKMPRRLSLVAEYDGGKLAGIADDIAQEISEPAVNATMQFLPNAEPVFEITDDVTGRHVDAGALHALMKAAMDQGVMAALSFESSPVAPLVTAEMFRNTTQLLASYTTVMQPDAVRNKNIRLAGDTVNGAVLMPGGEFSFNAATGERTKAKGYVDAPAISNGQIVDAPGGGVCQVSSTIYNAALLAGLDIVERHHHTRPVSYVPAGLDATVDWGNKDLRIRNQTEETVYLVFRVDEPNGLVTAEFYGMPAVEAISVSLENQQTLAPEKPIKYKISNKPIGWSSVITAARNGYKVHVYRVFSNGAETRRELLSNDYYMPQRGEIQIGTSPIDDDNK